MAVLEVENLRKSFRKGFFRQVKVEALKGVSFSVEREVFGFIGPNGAGKTTTIKAIMAFIRPDGGRISIFGSPPEEPSVRFKVGFLPERPYVYGSITGKEFLDFNADFFGIPAFERRRLYLKLLELVGLVGVENRPISSYSKGMVQRLLFAATLINDPELLILDEPMSGLDPVGRSIIASVIRELSARGKAVFFSSHIIQDVERLSDRVAIIVGGEVKLVDSVANLVHTFIAGYTVTYRKPGGDSLLTERVSKERLWSLLERLWKEGWEIVAVEPDRRSLEDILVSYIKEEDS
ncbi:ABC transporter related protein [Thermovibrio ammonificans HB-1]|uniref:ABC transporter related protein n=1 Tax=Thermovibrio ammonificans (strain DSM 15698 / JCM 12110 / HB-1) TaxID=648996 RepID=E8T3Q6_THEA1|nr:ABC transporter ATP-binding protein [Thermovibrio ammonificans]ADU97313.1 ABC transporter related protein [Thermovibrio ammonificans HB-1]